MQRGSDSAEFIIFRKEDEDDRVVTIIIAAVVSMFAGGLITTQSATPSASFQTTIDAEEQSFSMKVLSVSEPIDTADLKILITMTKNGSMFTGQVVPSSDNEYYDAGPFGLGMNVKGTGFTVGYDPDSDTDADKSNDKFAWSLNNSGQWFGNYSLYSGVTMSAQGEYELGYIFGEGGELGDPVIDGIPTNEVTAEQLTPYGTLTDEDTPQGVKVTIDGATKFFYSNEGYTATRSSGKIYVYPLGSYSKTVDILESGDTVNVRLIYTPSGQQIYSENVKVR